MELVNSPLVKNGEAYQVKSISVSELKSNYLSSLGMMVLDTQKLQTVNLFQCKQSGYRFFHPFDIGGDSIFYEQLEKFEWYYMPWKWEHAVSLKFVRPGNKVLEIGCAKGHFLLKLKNELQAEVFGLELNRSALKALEEHEIPHSANSIQEFSSDHRQSFDMVCSFQVLEHISDVHSFLESSVDVLKRNGKLIICVPNNDSFIKYDDGPLNSPPHHMGRWNQKSLEHIAKIFGLYIDAVKFEPLQKYHINWYYQLISSRHFPAIVNKILEKTRIKGIILWLIGIMRHQIKGHSILIVFNK